MNEAKKTAQCETKMRWGADFRDDIVDSCAGADPASVNTTSCAIYTTPDPYTRKAHCVKGNVDIRCLDSALSCFFSASKGDPEMLTMQQTILLTDKSTLYKTNSSSITSGPGLTCTNVPIFDKNTGTW